MEKEQAEKGSGEGEAKSTYSFESASCPRDFAQQRKVCEAVAGALGGRLLGYIIEDTGEIFLHTITATGKDAEAIAGYCGAMVWADTMWERGEGVSVEGRWEGMDDYPEEPDSRSDSPEDLLRRVESAIEEAFLGLEIPTTKH